MELGSSTGRDAAARAGIVGAVRVDVGAMSVFDTYENSVYVKTFADPAVLRDPRSGVYYAYSTQSMLGLLPVLRSVDLVHWTVVPDSSERPRFVPGPWVAPRTDGADGDLTKGMRNWAPHVLYNGSHYVLYYSARDAATGNSAIGVATSTWPTGPFQDLGAPLVSNPRPARNNSGEQIAILDPFAFVARNGRTYLYWGSGGQPIMVQELTSDGTALAPGSTPMVAARPGSWEDMDSLIEAPWVVEHDGLYYLFVSGDRFQREQNRYHVTVYRSPSPLFPATMTERMPGALVAPNAAYRSPGHNAVVADDAGEDWLVYHAYDAQGTARELLIDHIEWEHGWPVVNGHDGPSSTPQESPYILPAGDAPH